MQTKCHACGARKDPAALEAYPWPDEDRICDDPVVPLFRVDCSAEWRGGGWKCATVCHPYFHRLSPDLWVCRATWAALDPVVAFEDLPDRE